MEGTSTRSGGFGVCWCWPLDVDGDSLTIDCYCPLTDGGELNLAAWKQVPFDDLTSGISSGFQRQVQMGRNDSLLKPETAIFPQALLPATIKSCSFISEAVTASNN